MRNRYLFHWPEDEYLSPEEIEASSLKEAKAKAIAKLSNWKKDPLQHIDYVQNLDTGRKHYTFYGQRIIGLRLIGYVFTALLITGVIHCLIDSPETHQYDLYYSVDGQAQPTEHFKATMVWEYPESIEWVNDNDPEVEGTSMTRLGQIGPIDQGYRLIDQDENHVLQTRPSP